MFVSSIEEWRNTVGEYNIAYRDVRNSYSVSKAKKDILCHSWYYILRPLSFRLATIFIRCGWSATAVTILGFPFLLAGFLFIAAGGYERFAFGLTGGFLLNVWCVLDCVDGDIARATNSKSKLGNLLDFFFGQLFHYFTMISAATAIYISVSFPVRFLPQEMPRVVIFLPVAVDVVFAALRTIVSFKAKVSFDYTSVAARAESSKITPLNVLALLPMSFRAPLFVVAFLTNMLVPYLVLYAVYSFVTFVGMFSRCVYFAIKYDNR